MCCLQTSSVLPALSCVSMDEPAELEQQFQQYVSDIASTDSATFDKARRNFDQLRRHDELSSRYRQPTQHQLPLPGGAANSGKNRCAIGCGFGANSDRTCIRNW